MKPNDLPYNYPDASGHFGPYGGSFVSETLVFALEDLKAAYAKLKDDPGFNEELTRELKHFVGRPSPIYHARRWSSELGGAQIYFKREDLNHDFPAPAPAPVRNWPQAGTPLRISIAIPTG